MTISHHPPDDLLAGYAAGTLDEAEHLVVGVHLSGCAHCRRFVQALEHLAGATLETSVAAPMAKDAFAAVMARIERAPKPAAPPPAPVPADPELAGLPESLRRLQIGPRRRVAPGLSMRPIQLTARATSRAFLLRAEPGVKMLDHSHSGTELTCVLEGSFSHRGGRFGPGDFDYGDDDVDHDVTVGDEGPCLCIVAMTGDLRMHGLLGRLISPFVRL